MFLVRYLSILLLVVCVTGLPAEEKRADWGEPEPTPEAPASETEPPAEEPESETEEPAPETEAPESETEGLKNAPKREFFQDQSGTTLLYVIRRSTD